ncbi:MAG: NfeD family protein [Candidatus Methylomirabilis sp.]|nr:NfeD family protein [Deltaproteobacteria bacterium]
MEPWMWVAAGIVLALAELAIPSFTIVWFGLGAILVGALAWLGAVESLKVQILLWAALSTALTVLWFRYLKPKTKTLSGESKASVVGAAGVVKSAVNDDFHTGVVRFPVSVLGSDEWTFVADEALAPGDRAVVVDVVGEKLKVRKEA